MSQLHKSITSPTPTKGKDDDPLARIRAAAQELHRALSDAAAHHGEAMKSDLLSIPQKAQAVSASLKKSLGVQSAAVKRHLEDAATYLEAVQTHIADSSKSTGHAFEASVRRAVLDAHAAVKKISEAVAAKRTAASTPGHS